MAPGNTEVLGLSEIYAAPPDFEELLREKNAYFEEEEKINYDQPLKWKNIFSIFLVHILGIIGLVLGVPVIKFSSFVFISIWGAFGAIGMTAGGHRLWSHRSFKAKWQLRLILAVFFSISGLRTIFEWVRDHRVHHKFSESPADPHNAKRGLFFSHCGWIMKKKHPLVVEKGKKLDLADLERDEIVKFHDRHYLLLKCIFCFLLPILTLKVIFGEPWWLSFFANMVRYMISLNGTWVVNSLAHRFGSHPYDKNIRPAENMLVTVYAFGEGWHNFHHTFPWDYSSSEYGVHQKNATTLFIDFFALFGWAYDRKSVAKDSVVRHAKKAGDGSRVF